MNFQSRDLRALAMLILAVVGIVAYRSLSAPPAPEVVTSANSTELLERRLAKLRKTAALLPAKTDALKAVQAQLAKREQAVIPLATAPQAQAHLLDVVHRLAAANKIEPRGGDFSPPTLLGSDYGQVSASVLFECRIEDFVNFLADLSQEPELISPTEIHILAGNAKAKTISVRMTLAGVVSKKLVPEKRALGVL